MLQKVAWSRYFTRKESLKDVAVGILSKERAVKSYELGALKVEIWIEGLQYEDVLNTLRPTSYWVPTDLFHRMNHRRTEPLVFTLKLLFIPKLHRYLSITPQIWGDEGGGEGE